MKLVSLLLSRPPGKARHALTFAGDKHSVVRIDPRVPDRVAFDVVAVVDPVSQVSLSPLVYKHVSTFIVYNAGLLRPKSMLGRFISRKCRMAKTKGIYE